MTTLLAVLASLGWLLYILERGLARSHEENAKTFEQYCAEWRGIAAKWRDAAHTWQGNCERLLGRRARERRDPAGKPN